MKSIINDFAQISQTIRAPATLFREPAVCEKIRRAAKGRGKSGGVRIIYFWAVSREIVLMLDVYAKNEKSDLSHEEKMRLVDAKRDILGE